MSKERWMVEAGVVLSAAAETWLITLILTSLIYAGQLQEYMIGLPVLLRAFAMAG